MAAIEGRKNLTFCFKNDETTSCPVNKFSIIQPQYGWQRLKIRPTADKPQVSQKNVQKKSDLIQWPPLSERNNADIRITGGVPARMPLIYKPKFPETQNKLPKFPQNFTGRPDFERFLTPANIQGALKVIDYLLSHILQLCLDLYSTPTHHNFCQRYETVLRSACPVDDEQNIEQRRMCHLGLALSAHRNVLQNLYSGRLRDALSLIEQIAVHHGLLGVESADFEIFNDYIVEYLIKNKLISDKAIGDVLCYFHTFTSHIRNFLQSQNPKNRLMDSLIAAERRNDRDNNARKNYRLMKQWKARVGSYKNDLIPVEEQIKKLSIPATLMEDST